MLPAARPRPAAPLVSVALCTYNGARFLPAQLDSVLLQSYAPLEIVAVDDHSQDATVEILESYARRDARMRVSVNPENLGFRRNFERALTACRGEFIAPCDQDDVWAPSKLARLVAAIGPRDLAYCDSELTDATGTPLGRRMSDIWRMGELADPAAFILDNCVSGHALLLRRALLERALPVPPGFYYDAWLATVASASGGVAYCPAVLVQYRQHSTNITDLSRTRRHALRLGAGSRRVRAVGERLAAIAALPGSHQNFVHEFETLWHRQTSQWLSGSLAWFVARNARRLYALRLYSRWKLHSRALRYLWGLRLKRRVQRRRHADETGRRPRP